MLQRRHELHRFYGLHRCRTESFGSSGFTGVDVRTDTDVTVRAMGVVRAICFLVYLLGVQLSSPKRAAYWKRPPGD